MGRRGEMEQKRGAPCRPCAGPLMAWRALFGLCRVARANDYLRWRRNNRRARATGPHPPHTVPPRQADDEDMPSFGEGAMAAQQTTDETMRKLDTSYLRDLKLQVGGRGRSRSRSRSRSGGADLVLGAAGGTRAGCRGMGWRFGCRPADSHLAQQPPTLQQHCARLDPETDRPRPRPAPPRAAPPPPPRAWRASARCSCARPPTPRPRRTAAATRRRASGCWTRRASTCCRLGRGLLGGRLIGERGLLRGGKEAFRMRSGVWDPGVQGSGLGPHLPNPDPNFNPIPSHPTPTQPKPKPPPPKRPNPTHPAPHTPTPNPPRSWPTPASTQRAP